MNADNRSSAGTALQNTPAMPEALPPLAGTEAGPGSAAYRLSIVLPAKNEAAGLRSFLPRLRKAYPDAELVVVDDGSSDDTGEVAREGGARVVRHPFSLGNGGAIKAGARAATGDVLFFMDADGQHEPEAIEAVLHKLEEGYDMVVGARSGNSQASTLRWIANTCFNRFASYMVGHHIPDLTSGFRAVRARPFRSIMHLLPNTFSYPTTSTMSFFRAGYPVAYVPIKVKQRIGRSHIKLIQDGSRFLLIIFKIGTLYSPLRIFAPVSGIFFGLASLHYWYSFALTGRFTNMTAFLYVTSVIILLIGLISEQITLLTYRDTERS
jgi:glycosyltransferase involved in cell wall biosynthesis